MTPAHENELLRTIRTLKQEIAEIKELVTPIAPNKNKFIGVEEACKMLNCSRWKIYRLIAENKLFPQERKGRRIIFSEYDIISYIRS